MRKTKLISVLTISVLYCLAIGLYSKNGIADKSGLLHCNSDTEQFNTLSVSDVLCHTAKTESSVTVFNNAQPGSLKNPFNQFSDCIKTTEQLFFNSYSQYHFYAQCLLIRLQQYDIIFPFQYFW